MNLENIELNRWEKGIEHDPRSLKIVEALVQIDWQGFDGYFDWRMGGDGDNGESLAFELDVYFELLDRNEL